MEPQPSVPRDPLALETPRRSASRQFSLRSLLACVAIAAVLLALVGREVRHRFRQAELVDHFLARGATLVERPGRWPFSSEVVAIEFHGRTIGADAMPLEPADVALLAELDLAHTDVADEDLAALATMSALREIHLQDTDTTYEGVDRLQAALPELQIWDD